MRIEINQKIVGKEEYVNGEGVTGGTASMSENRRSANGCKAGQGRAGQGKGGREHPKPPRLPQTTEASTREDCTGE